MQHILLKDNRGSVNEKKNKTIYFGIFI